MLKKLFYVPKMLTQKIEIEIVFIQNKFKILYAKWRREKAETHFL